MRKLTRLVVLVIGIAAFLLTAGFWTFARHVVEARPPADVRADGIVVLTGGAARIESALALLVENRARRLLVSGANPVVTPGVLASRMSKDLRDEIACCVDLGHAARDTIGNAAETRAWAVGHDFRSLIVVTSDYHMARSMAELAAAMPETELIAFPVSNPDLHLDQWWHKPSAFGLLVREYLKFIAGGARRAMSAG
jgi:uncharacterized SAM-binding protein YcdF (DUF218 family)